MKDKVGVFVCRCSGIIGDVLDVDQLAGQLENEDGVVFVACHDLLCAGSGQEFVSEKMKEHGATRAVIAACSPKDHEVTFQKALERAGVNKYLMQMANIREHCSWVTRDKAAALTKAAALVKGALRRVRHHERLEEKKIDCNSDLLIVGGGIAGMEAALLAAEADRQVYLVESEPSLGGTIAQYEEVAPNLECAPCMLSPRLDEVSECENIHLYTNAKVTEVLGYLGNFTAKIDINARLVDSEKCIGCDECIQACPASFESDFDQGLGHRKAIDVPFPGSVPNCAIVYREHCKRFNGEECSACADACPMEAVDFNQTDQTVEISVGAIVIATGFETYQPDDGRLTGWKELPDVYTLSQFERLSSNHGPTEGKILKADGTIPSHVVVVHCVGRGELGYCSQICCQSSLKIGMILKHREAEEGETSSGQDVRVTHIHSDLVSGGWLGGAFLRRVVSEGSHFVHTVDPSSMTVHQNGANLFVGYTDIRGEPQELEADMVVLATGMKPSTGTKELAEMLSLVVDDAGFIAPDHPLLRPSQSSLAGVYVAGCASGPKGITDSVAQSKAAAGSALSRVQPGRKLSVEVITAHTNSEQCSKCLVCVSVCPYRACVFDRENDRVSVAEILCHGCGTCVAACASGAAQARQFTDEQIMIEIGGVLDD